MSEMPSTTVASISNAFEVLRQNGGGMARKDQQQRSGMAGGSKAKGSKKGGDRSTSVIDVDAVGWSASGGFRRRVIRVHESACTVADSTRMRPGVTNSMLCVVACGSHRTSFHALLSAQQCCSTNQPPHCHAQLQRNRTWRPFRPCPSRRTSTRGVRACNPTGMHLP